MLFPDWAPQILKYVAADWGLQHIRMSQKTLWTKKICFPPSPSIWVNTDSQPHCHQQTIKESDAGDDRWDIFFQYSFFFFVFLIFIFKEFKVALTKRPTLKLRMRVDSDGAVILTDLGLVWRER